MNIRDALPRNLQAALDEIGEWEPSPPTLPVECPSCLDLGQIKYDVPYGDERFGRMFPCPDCAKGRALFERQWRARLVEAELPAEYQHLTFETWARLPKAVRQGKGLALACAQLFVNSTDHSVSLTTAHRMAGREWQGVEVTRRSLVLQGPPGVGKTGLAAAIVNALIEQRKPVLYIRTQDFIESVKATFGKNSDALTPEGRDLVSIVKQSPRLVLDEFNLALTGEWRQEVVENVIRYRYGNALPTIITCNATQTELEMQWGTRTTSVLFAMAHWVPLGGAVLRNLQQPEGEAF